jgi:glutathionyl-hydroquinone reductase
MGQLVDGVWHSGWYEPDNKGAFKRPSARFRDRVSNDGSTDFPAAANRYHLYVSYACPWAHRTLIVRALRGLEGVLPITVVDPKMGDDGWQFDAASPDPYGPGAFLREVYLRANPEYSGRVTVPVLWDRERRTIVNNESREVMRMLDDAFGEWSVDPFVASLAPADLREAVDAAITENYEPINNGVYRAGFATTQDAYADACEALFAALDRCERTLGQTPYLCGEVVTEADIALFTTLVRFDLVYFAHFKCNLKRIVDYPNLSAFAKRVYALPGVAATCDFDHIKTHYYWSQTTVNPHRIVPLGPPEPALAFR